MAFFNKKEKAAVDFQRLPRHIAIIMDGNGRWANRRGCRGRRGMRSERKPSAPSLPAARRSGFLYLTVFAFLRRIETPPDEVSTIMGLLEKYLEEAIEKMVAENLKLK
jgi:undecaprenyl diphosphate synthase